jgi:ABC-type transport system involved in cytochrome bd biosynthesis, fused ATPase and permease components
MLYCRKCGKKISDQAKFCADCGTAVVKVKQRSDAEKFDEIRAKKVALKQQNKTQIAPEYSDLKNPYVIPALSTAIIAFALGIFPWPPALGIGTSLWMRILIFVIALLSSYHSMKAKQVNRLYQLKYNYEIKSKYVKIATILSTITLMVALFSLIV